MEDKLHYIIYISTEAVKFTDEILADILTVSRKNNKQRGITGILIYSNGNIMQLLEGSEEKIKRTYKSIRQDLRHTAVTTLIDRPLISRNFPDWYMSFHAVNQDVFSVIEGYKNPGEHNLLPNETSDDSIISLLKTFIALNPTLKHI